MLKRPNSKFLRRLLALTKPLQALAMRRGGRFLRTVNDFVSGTGHYERTYPELRDSGFLPVVDYLLFGAAEGRNPHPLFSTSYYLNRYPDVKLAGKNPLVHFLRRGGLEDRDPHPLFSASYYREKYRDVAAASANPLIHYLQFGMKERRRPHPLFDPGYYYATQTDVAAAGEETLTHYVTKGAWEGRAPNPEFDPAYYLAVHTDVAEAGKEPLEHYILFGRAEGRSIRAPADAAHASRVAATVERLRHSELEVRLSFTNSPAGGARRYIERAEGETREQVAWLHLTGATDSHVTLSCKRPGYEFESKLHGRAEYGQLIDLLKKAGVARIHMHQIAGSPIDFKAFTADMGVPYDVTLHDYYFVCPSWAMVGSKGAYCGEPVGRECESCVASVKVQKLGLDVPSWRRRSGILLAGAGRVFAHSVDIAECYMRYYPWLEIGAADEAHAPAKTIQTRTVRAAKRAGRKRVLALVGCFQEGQMQPGAYIRVVQPLTHAGIASEIDFSVVDFDSAMELEADAVIVQRVSIEHKEQAERLIDYCATHRVRLIYETDDDLFRLPEDHPEIESYRGLVEVAKLIAGSADAITVSTEPLREHMSADHKNVVVIPNWLDERLWRSLMGGAERVDGNGRPRPLYMGTVSHRADLAFLEEPVRRLRKELDFELDVIGITDDAGRDPWFRCVSVPADGRRSYLRFAVWLQGAGCWDFGLAPLGDQTFNTSKSAIKAYEYGALGLATVASDVVSYRTALRDGETGLLVKNTAQDWYESLKRMCETRALRETLQGNVLRKRGQWTLSANAESLRRLWRQALFDE